MLALHRAVRNDSGCHHSPPDNKNAGCGPVEYIGMVVAMTHGLDMETEKLRVSTMYPEHSYDHTPEHRNNQYLWRVVAITYLLHT